MSTALDDTINALNARARALGMHKNRERYVSARDIPDPAPAPARPVQVRPPADAPPEVEVREQTIVEGSAQLVFNCRCSCGRRWFMLELEPVQTCPRCNAAVMFMRGGAT